MAKTCGVHRNEILFDNGASDVRRTRLEAKSGALAPSRSERTFRLVSLRLGQLEGDTHMHIRRFYSVCTPLRQRASWQIRGGSRISLCPATLRSRQRTPLPSL